MVGPERHGIDEPGALPAWERGAIPEVVRVYGVHGVGDADLLVEVGLARMQRHADGPAGPQGLFEVAHLQVGRAVRVRPDQGIDGRDDRHRVHLRSGVPLHAAADERPAHGDHARLDHAVEVKRLLALGLVQHGMEPPAQFRQAGHLQVLVLQEQRLVRAVLLLAGQMVLHRVGVHDRPLDGRRELDLVLQGPELRVDVLLPAIGGDRDRPLPGPGLRFRPPRRRLNQNQNDKRNADNDVPSQVAHNRRSASHQVHNS